MDAVNRAVQLGVKADAEESNRMMKNIKTSGQFHRDPLGYAIDFGGLVVSALDLGVAVSASGMRGIATLNNLRVARRYNRAIHLAQATQ